jgi:hypothetical protein
LIVFFSDVQYEYRYESCSSGWESKNIVGEPKSMTGRSDIVGAVSGSSLSLGLTLRPYNEADVMYALYVGFESRRMVR